MPDTQVTWLTQESYDRLKAELHHAQRDPAAADRERLRGHLAWAAHPYLDLDPLGRPGLRITRRGLQQHDKLALALRHQRHLQLAGLLGGMPDL